MCECTQAFQRTHWRARWAEARHVTVTSTRSHVRTDNTHRAAFAPESLAICVVDVAHSHPCPGMQASTLCESIINTSAEALTEANCSSSAVGPADSRACMLFDPESSDASVCTRGPGTYKDGRHHTTDHWNSLLVTMLTQAPPPAARTCCVGSRQITRPWRHGRGTPTGPHDAGRARKGATGQCARQLLAARCLHPSYFGELCVCGPWPWALRSSQPHTATHTLRTRSTHAHNKHATAAPGNRTPSAQGSELQYSARKHPQPKTTSRRMPAPALTRLARCRLPLKYR